MDEELIDTLNENEKELSQLLLGRDYEIYELKRRLEEKDEAAREQDRII